MERDTITLAVIEKLIGAKMNEFGLSSNSPLHLDKSILVKNGPILSGNAKRVLERRYLKKDADGKVIETPETMFRRVARHIAKAEEKYGDATQVAKMQQLFYWMMTEFTFLPNSPTMMNAGRRLGQLAACFVLPVEDSLDGIFSALKNAAGGPGFLFRV
jgi:ribonucleoside-diphosphate reductase alpha chain